MITFLTIIGLGALACLVIGAITLLIFGGVAIGWILIKVVLFMASVGSTVFVAVLIIWFIWRVLFGERK